MLYYTFATPWYTDLHMFSEKKSLVMSANLTEVKRQQKSIASFASALHATVGGAEPPTSSSCDDDTHFGSYGHPHYTERFDLLIAEALSHSSQAPNRGTSIQNAAAVIAFGTISVIEKQRLMQQTVDAFCLPGLHYAKHAELQALQSERRTAGAQRAAGEGQVDEAFIPASSFRGPREGYTYKTGEEGLGYYHEHQRENALSNATSGTASSATGAQNETRLSYDRE